MAKRVLVDALGQVLDATYDEVRKVASADADAARPVVEMASPFRDGAASASRRSRGRRRRPGHI